MQYSTDINPMSDWNLPIQTHNQKTWLKCTQVIVFNIHKTQVQTPTQFTQLLTHTVFIHTKLTVLRLVFLMWKILSLSAVYLVHSHSVRLQVRIYKQVNAICTVSARLQSRNFRCDTQTVTPSNCFQKWTVVKHHTIWSKGKERKASPKNMTLKTGWQSADQD